MEIDTAISARFLTALTGDRVHTFQTFPEGRSDKTGGVRVFHGDFHRYANSLEKLNSRGVGVFVMVNRGDCKGRKAVNVIAARALFVDLDGAPLDPVLRGPLAPRIVVESSPGKWHCYWPVADLPLAPFTVAQKVLARRFGGDPKVCDLPRVMRLPGFLHRKANPFRTKLIQAEDTPLTWREVSEAFDLRDHFRLADVIPEGERNTTLFNLARSAANMGVPKERQLAKAGTVNAQRCHPPLPESEVLAVVESAYRAPVGGGVGMPNALVDSPAYKAARNESRALMAIAYRRATPDGLVTLPFSELRDWYPHEAKLERHRKFAVEDGLMTVHTAATKAMPRKGRGPKPHVYRLKIPPVYKGYSGNQIPAVHEGPDALQDGKL